MFVAVRPDHSIHARSVLIRRTNGNFRLDSWCPAGDPSHFAEAIIREILSLPFFDSLQNETGHEFRLVAIGVIGGRSAIGRAPHPVLAEVCRGDKRVDFTNDDAVLFQLGACRETEAKKRTFRRRVNAVLGNSHERSSRIDVHDASAALVSHHRNYRLDRDDRPQNIEMEYFIKNLGLDLLYRSRIAAPGVIYEPVDAAVILVNSAHGFPHTIKLRHVCRDRQAAGKLLRDLLQRIATAGQEGNFRAAISQSHRRRQPDPRRSARDNEYVIFDLQGLISYLILAFT